MCVCHPSLVLYSFIQPSSAVFHVKDELGNKITDQHIINDIHQVTQKLHCTVPIQMKACNFCFCQAIGSNSVTGDPKVLKPQTCSDSSEPKAIEMTGKDRPGLFSEISAALADLHCNIVEAHAWSHNARLACVAYIEDQSMHTPIDDHRLHAIEDHLTSVLRATTAVAAKEENAQQQNVKPAGIPKWELSTTAKVERRLHQLMLSVRDFDRPRSPSLSSDSDDEENRRKCIVIESCIEKGYSIVTIQCKDRRRLMFDTVCTLTDMQYVIFHASVDSHGGYAFQVCFFLYISHEHCSYTNKKIH